MQIYLINERHKATHPGPPEPSAARLGPRAFSTGVMDGREIQYLIVDAMTFNVSWPLR